MGRYIMKQLSMPPSNSWVGFDLDGTLAMYEGWKGKEHIGEPIPSMIDLLKRHLELGVEVKIFTARVSDPDERVKIAIEKWCIEHIGRALPITNVKDFAMIRLYDDRAVQVITNRGIIVKDFTLKPLWLESL